MSGRMTWRSLITWKVVAFPGKRFPHLCWHFHRWTLMDVRTISLGACTSQRRRWSALTATMRSKMARAAREIRIWKIIKLKRISSYRAIFIDWWVALGEWIIYREFPFSGARILCESPRSHWIRFSILFISRMFSRWLIVGHASEE